MSQEYLLTRKAALLARADETDPDIEKTIGQLAAVGLAVSGGGGSSTDISTLATEATATAINGKLPSLSSGRIPVSLLSTNLTADWQDLTTDTVIAAGSCYVYLEVILGPVTINGLSFSTGKFLNLESSPFARHPEINLVISAGKSVRLIRGY